MAWRLRTGCALALLVGIWLWAYGNLGGVALAQRCLLLTGAALATAGVLWPRPQLSPWAAAVGLFLYGGVALAPVSQLPGWMLAAVVWSSWIVVSRALTADRRLLWLLPAGLLTVALGQACLGLWQAQQGGLVRGTLRNPNHFAGAMALALGLALGWVWWAWQRTEGRLVGRWLAPSACGLLLAAVVASGSRGGLLSAGAVLAFVYLLLRWRPRRRATGTGPQAEGRRLGVLLVCWGLAWCLATWWVTEPLHIEGLERRLLVYQGTAEMILDHPWIGIGPGHYRWGFRPYQRFDTSKHFDHAHNDYLQIAAEWGLPLSFLLWVFVGRRWWSAWRRFEADAEAAPRPGARKAVALAVAAALLAPWVHGWMDFDLQIPALAMQVAMLLALTTGLGQDRGPSTGVWPDRRTAVWKTADPWRWPLSLALSAFLVLAVIRAEGLRIAYGEARGSEQPAVIEQAIERAPRAASLHFQLAMLRRDKPPHRDPKVAKEHFETAIHLNPHSWRYRVELGWLYEQLGLNGEAWQAYRQALRLNPRDADYQRRLAGFSLRRGATSRGKALLAQAVAQDPRRLTESGALLLSAVTAQEVVAWWPRQAEVQDELLELLADHLAAQPTVSSEEDRLLATVWQRWLESLSAEGSAVDGVGDVYVRYLLQRGRGQEARRQWLRWKEHDPTLPSATLEEFASGRNLIWNGDFEAPLGPGVLAWRVPGRAGQTTTLLPGEGIDGSTALAMDFDRITKMDFKRLRQHLVVEPSTAYVLEYHLRSDQLSGPGLGLQVIDARSRRPLMRGETVLGTTPWRSGRGYFETSADSHRVIVRLATGPSADTDSTLAGRLYMDRLRLGEEASP